MDARPSGWYDDPDEPNRLRYWDGESWTERTHFKAPMPDPLPPKPPVSRLRTAREEREDGADRDGARDRGIRSAAQEQGRPELTAANSPRPWSTETGGRTTRQGAPGDASSPYGPDAAAAGYGRRVLAFLLDLLVVSAVFLVLLMVLLPFLPEVTAMQQSYAQGILRAWQQQQMPPEPPAALIQVNTVLTLIYAGLFVLYDTVLLRAAAATVGCLATGIRVVDAAGGRAPAGRLLWRSVLKYLGFLFNARPETVLAGYLFTVVNFLWPLRGGKRLALHDQWSATRVIRT